MDPVEGQAHTLGPFLDFSSDPPLPEVRNLLCVDSFPSKRDRKCHTGCLCWFCLDQ